jgi:hypothetical protein
MSRKSYCLLAERTRVGSYGRISETESSPERIILDAKLGGHELQAGDVDRDGDVDIVSKAWGCLPWNALGGKMHVDFLENRTR